MGYMVTLMAQIFQVIVVKIGLATTHFTQWSKFVGIYRSTLNLICYSQ